MRRPFPTALASLAGSAALLAGALAFLPLSPAEAGTGRGSEVISRDVVFDVENSNATPVACTPDDKSYVLHAELVGPRREVLGANVPRLNVLVHDLATGSWFWHLHRHPAYDYAARLARAGETSLVARPSRVRREPAARTATPPASGAQADMLHQVVQHAALGQLPTSRDSTRPPRRPSTSSSRVTRSGPRSPRWRPRRSTTWTAWC